MSIDMVLITAKGKKFYVKDKSKDLHTQYGYIKAAELAKVKPGTTLTTNTGTKLTVLKPSFIDIYKKIKRIAQIIPLKDIGSIITETGINNKSKVLDAGAGSGGLACFLAHIAKEVITYDIREDFIKIVEHNKELLDLSNLKIKQGSVYDSVKEKNFDLFTLDVPEPWLAIKTAEKALQVGGFFVSYSPTIPQVSDFVEALKRSDKLIHLKTIEITEREWDVDCRKVRPRTQGIGHSGFITFARKISK